MKHTIIAIVGPSGAGKTAISKAMAKAGIPYVVSYTTRPMREGETDGVEHHFISEEDVLFLVGYLTYSRMDVHEPGSLPQVPAYTRINGYRYFVTQAQLLEHPVVTYVIDEKGLLELEQWALTERVLGRAIHIIPVYIDRDKAEIARHTDAERMARDDERTALPYETYTIRVINDSPSLDQLNLWAENFGFALNTVIKSTGIKPCTLHTSDAVLLHIVNKLNYVQHHG